MDLSLLPYIFLPLASIMSVLGAVVFHHAKKTAETNYEKEMKQLRKLWFMGKLDRKTYLYIRDNMKIEELFTDESKRLDDMFNQKKLDPFDYIRIKKVLQMTVNNKIVTIEQKYDPSNSQEMSLQQNCN